MLKQIIKGMFILGYFFICNSYADGIIQNLNQYLQRYPQRIDEQGWVTIPRSDLFENTQYFDTNCDYKLVHSDTSIALPIQVTKYSFMFQTVCDGNYLHRIAHSNKNKIWACTDGYMSKKTSSLLQVTAFMQLSPESIKYARNKHLKSMLPSSSEGLVQLIVKMDKRIKELEKKKSCCDNCTIL
ncbi:MAG: hypothetical protein HRT87_05050 [Legionellales bacterium]|nr:hypothetical protein [Legionellales bacterium]